MAYVLLGIVIENLGSFIREELATFLGVDELTQKLSRNLTYIRAVLPDAKQKQITTQAVEVWLQNLVDAAHVLDDILDECSITSKAHGGNKWITRFRPKKILARRNIVKRMKAVAEKIDAIAVERRKYLIRLEVREAVEYPPWHETSSVIAEPKVYGRDGDREQVVEFLLRHAVDSEELSVYSIVGKHGLGKTTLAQVVFNDRRVNNHFDFKIWVCVSSGFSMMEILESIIESTTGTIPDHSSLESMQKAVQEILLNNRFLLVLDDVWSEDQEKWIKFMYLLQRGNVKKGASVLVTTRFDTVASIMGTYPAHHLGGLSDDDIWSLFKQQAFGANKEERAELVAVGKEIVRKCVGSPFAAKVLGSHLHFESEEHQWISIKESNPWWNLIDDNALIYVLRQSYLNLKLSSRLCFTFCAVFPKDFEIHKECLIHLWMANGLITSREDLQMEHVGDEVWNELHQNLIFQEVKSDVVGNITFKMSDSFQKVAQSIMGDECVASEVSSLTNLSTRVHHISCFDTKGNFDYSMIPIKKVDSLRTFLEFKPPSKNLDVLLSVAPLRALRTSSSELSALKSLIHLRYLELCNSDITTLPECVCRLPKLQTLKLEGCIYFSSFPNQLTQLQDLRHLMIENCPSLVSTPFRIGELTCLKTLTIFIVGGSEDGFGLEELHNLQLVGKLHIKGLENVSNEKDAREANLIGKKDLNRLYLSWGDYANSQDSDVDAEGVLEALEPHSGLKSFGVKSYGGAHFPPWMRNTSILEGLVHIILYDCKNCKKLPPLGKLPFLTTLYVCGMRDVKYIDDALYEPATEKAFTSLKKLTLCDLPNLEGVLEVEGVEMLPELLNLSISCVPKLALPSLPSVEFLSAHGGAEVLLKFISYKNCDEDLASSSRGIVGNNMYNLKSLYISDVAKLKELPDELGTLCVLEHLHIQFCDEMESFSENLLQGLCSLRTLTINHCHGFKSLSEGIKHLTCLERLQITYCPQFIFPHNMNSQTALRQLKVSGHNENMLDGLEGIPSLQNLSLTYFLSLTSLPDWLGAMTSLQVLEISRFPKLSSLPDSFQQLQNLKKLSITYCSKLETRCEKGIGEDWHKIAHVPELELEDSFDVKPTFRENTTSEWMLGNQFCHRPKFESVVDVL
ncbi:hypothetical protein P8452_55225 [Trifolium repens]|nr:hypothetical protein P8452_55225 [Trifolium repens]